MAGRVRPAGGRGTSSRSAPGQVKTSHPKGTVCEGKNCTTLISVYNPDHICSLCDQDDREVGAMERRMNEIQRRLVEKGKAA